MSSKFFWANQLVNNNKRKHNIFTNICYEHMSNIFKLTPFNYQTTFTHLFTKHVWYLVPTAPLCLVKNAVYFCFIELTLYFQLDIIKSVRGSQGATTSTPKKANVVKTSPENKVFRKGNFYCFKQSLKTVLHPPSCC